MLPAAHDTAGWGTLLPHAMLGFAHYADARYGLWNDCETALVKARAYVERAFELDRENSDASTT
jgi:hypothetical protein